MLPNVFAKVLLILIINQVYCRQFCENLQGVITCESATNITFELLSRVSNISEVESINIRSTCPLEVIPGAFKSIAKVELVPFSYNSIHELRNGTFNNPSIKVIEITDNSIGSIHPETFSNLERLESIELSGNRIKTSNDCNSEANLQKLPIDPTWLKNLPKLKTLKLTRNELKSIYVHQLVTYPQRLELLYLSNNNLTSVTNDMLHQLSNLLVLNLDHNMISHIEPNSFGQTPKLKVLNLYRNVLKEIDVNVFPLVGMEQLDDLRLSFNKLMYLSPEIFEKMEKLKQISIGGNPWWCGCLIDIEKLLEKKKIMPISGDYSLYYDIDNKPICVSESVQDRNCKESYNSVLSEQFEKTFKV